MWGDRYRIATKQLNITTERHGLSKEMAIKTIEELFPNRDTRKEKEHHPVEAPPFTEEELLAASRKLKPKKAPGPDGLPPEVVKIVATSVPQLLLNLMNALLKVQKFPDEWKISDVILITKPGKLLGGLSSYRPICLLNTTSKLLEQLIVARLIREIEEKEVLSTKSVRFSGQKVYYGCRK